jgi:NAD(P)-dependent dehydrogenase (short-subunit alcohol dehydrogenase family)
VVSVLGFAAFGTPPTATSLDAVKAAFDDGVFNNFLAAKYFLPSLKSIEGASYTIVSGGLAHIPPPFPGLWLATVKNAALNALSNSLASETAKDAVRVNTICIHFGVAAIGGNKNQYGMAAESDTLRLGPAFLGVARGSHKGQIICLDSWETADRIAAQ